MVVDGGAFDAPWYRAAYPESAGWEDPILHYLAIGAAAGNLPCAVFDPGWWCEVRGFRYGVDPFLDYLSAPERWRVAPSPYLQVESRVDPEALPRTASPLGLFLASRGRAGLQPVPLFDAAYYLANQPDVAAAGVDPLLHYAASGGREGRSPSPMFDAAWYLDQNPDVRDAGAEPLRHFMMRGARQGRAPHRSIDMAELAARAGPGEDALNVLLRHASGERHTLTAHTHPRLPPAGGAAVVLDDWPWRPGAAALPRIVVVRAGIGGPDRAAAVARWAATTPIGIVACDAAATAGVPADVGIPLLTLTDLAGPEGAAGLLRPLMRAVAAAGPDLALVIDGPADHPARAAAAAAGLAAERLDTSTAAAAPRPAVRNIATLSVVVPSYRHAAFLEERLSTILAQRRRPDEIVVIDDASDDGSVAIARAVAAHAPVPIAVVARRDNAGSPFPVWAEGVARTRGDLVWIAESDDVADPRLLARLAPLLEADARRGLAYCQSAVIGACGERIADDHLFYTDAVDRRRWEAPYVAEGAEEIAAALAIQNTIPNVSAVLFRRAALLPVLPAIAADRYCGDWRAYALIAAAGWRIAYSPETLSRARRHPGTTTLAGERDPRAAAEAAAIRRELWSRPDVPAQTIRRGLSRQAFEWDDRTARHGLARAAFATNEEFRALRDAAARLMRARAEATGAQNRGICGA